MPDEKLTLDAVATLAARSQVPVPERLISVMNGRDEALEIHGPLPASSAIRTYQVRLQLWRDDVLPTMAGFPEFVEALDRAGNAAISITVYDEPSRSRRFVLLLDAEHSALLGAVELATATGGTAQSDEALPLPT